MFSRTVEGILLNAGNGHEILYVPVPFNPGAIELQSIDDCNTDYWVDNINTASRCRNLDLYRKTIEINHNGDSVNYTIHFADQTENILVNHTVQTFLRRSMYNKWVGSILIIKSNKNGYPIPCKGRDGIHVTKAIEKYVNALS